MLIQVCWAVAVCSAGWGAEPANGAVQVSLRAANYFVEREQATETDFAQKALEAANYGTERTIGRLTSAVVPGSEPAVVEFRFAGVSTNENGLAFVREQNVTVYHSTRTEIDARKRVVLDAEGVRMTPAVATCRTSMQIQWIESPRRVVQLTARRRAGRQQAEAEFQKSRTIAEQVERQLDEQVDQQLSEANGIYLEKVVRPLRAQNAFPKLVRTRSIRNSRGKTHLQARLLHQNPGQQLPPSTLVALNPGHDVALVVHESLAANMFESLWSAVTIHDEQILAFFKAATGAEPRSLWVHDRRPRWSFTFANQRPVTVAFRDGRFRITLRGKRITQGERSADIPFDVSATYHPHVTIDGPHLVREGAIKLQVSREASKSFTDDEFVGWESFLSWKFNGVFPPDIYFDTLAPPAGVVGDKLRRFRLIELTCDDQWAKIGYELETEE